MRLFNNGWEFSKQPLHTDLKTMQRLSSDFSPVGIPHDWLIYQADQLYEDGTGWYRKYFMVDSLSGKEVFLRFDGIYMDSRIFVNGQQAGEWKYGYSTFEVDITKYLHIGENEILVSVDFQAPNSRWYSGAGIYRNVWLKILPKEHIIADGIYFHASPAQEGYWDIEIETEVEAGEDVVDSLHVEYGLKKKEDEQFLVLTGSETVEKESSARTKFLFHTTVSNPDLWDVEKPFCYELQVTLKKDHCELQQEIQTVGFRTLTFLPEQGFLLNGRKVKLQGVCEHHDLGCLGAAFHKKAMKRKLTILKKMGVNAIRTSHNMPAPELMELADEMGILIVSEAFDMWESSKTTYDYGRFFTQWYEKDVESWVRRDRNHPSLIMWSIGNEIYDTHVGERGQYWCRVLRNEVKKYDGKGNAAVTIGSNYMPWENAQKCADIIKNAGYNYGEKYYEKHHQKYPDLVIYGSETASVVQSRGIYHFPYRQSVLTDEDEQCSSLGNSTTSWGAESAEACIRAEIEHPYSCGQFIWTGFDYIGEPTPYHTRNSYFGQIDTAGFPKDSYYIYQSAWTNYKTNPMIHIMPYWDFNEGQLIDVRVCSNAPMVELFLNGKSQGICPLDHENGTRLVGDWQIPYEKGELYAVAMDEGGTIVAEERRFSFGEVAEICLEASDTELKADGEDLLFIEISMKDEARNPVENANNLVRITVEGAGALVGTDNGDSTDNDGYKDFERKLFSGKLLAVCKAGTTGGILTVRVSSPGLTDGVLQIPVRPAEIREGISTDAYLAGAISEKYEKKAEIQVRNLLLSSSHGAHLGVDNMETEVTVRFCPENASDKEVIWNIVDDAGIPLKIAEVESKGEKAIIRAKSDGKFRLRCMSRCGTDKVRVISSLEFEITGLGVAFTNPYDFVSAGQYDYCKGEIGNGNEHGVATARDGESQIGFRNIDFGAYGSDEITISIFALTDDPYQIQIYEGMPEEDGQCIGVFIYQKPSIWNVYQEETFRLNKRLRGITSICFVLKAKVHIKGFRFSKYNRALQKLAAGECDKIYGDYFKKDGEVIREIGNNVTLEFRNMEFGEKGVEQIQISGKTPLEKNTILLKVTDGQKEGQQMLEFGGDRLIQSFYISRISGTQDISFVFLPGSNFDFEWFQFI